MRDWKQFSLGLRGNGGSVSIENNGTSVFQKSLFSFIYLILSKF